MGTTPQDISYLLRLRSTGYDRQPVWRAMVEDPLSGERHGFASPELLFGFLRHRMAGSTDQPGPEGGDDTDQRE